MRRVILLTCLIVHSESYRFLLVSPLPVRSVNLLGQAHAENLMKAGHEITFITAFPWSGKPHKSLRIIDVKSTFQVLDSFIYSSYNLFEKEHLADPTEILHYQELSVQVANVMFNNTDVQNVLDDPGEQFDAVIADLYECQIYSGLAVLFQCPMIYDYSMVVHAPVLRLADGIANPAYTASYYSTNHPPFSFRQRIEELWLKIKWTLAKELVILPKEEREYMRIFGPPAAKRGISLPAYKDVFYNVSLILVNEYSNNVDIPSTPQNLKFIAGHHIREPVNPLPTDLQSVMDNAEHGVIYFSLGSFIKSKDLPQSIKEELLKAFAKLKQIVIWKFEEDTAVPENVHIVKWAPQLSILAHPNLRIFISHGGLLSTIEATHFGVPIIGVPIIMDQYTNLLKGIKKGTTIKVNLNYKFAQNLERAIHKMLTDDRYRKRAKEASAIYHDRPISARQEALHWIEHVVRTRGATHLRSPASRLHWYQRLYLDLMAVLLALLTVSVISLCKLWKTLYGKKGKIGIIKKND